MIFLIKSFLREIIDVGDVRNSKWPEMRVKIIKMNNIQIKKTHKPLDWSWLFISSYKPSIL